MNRKYAINPKFVKKSPFKTVSKLQNVLAQYNQGQSIGFTYIASLKSMGLLPRKNGQYCLGEKYRQLG